MYYKLKQVSLFDFEIIGYLEKELKYFKNILKYFKNDRFFCQKNNEDKSGQEIEKKAEREA